MPPANDPAISTARDRVVVGLLGGRARVSASATLSDLRLSGPIVILPALMAADALAALAALHLGTALYAALGGAGLAVRGVDPLLSLGALTMPIGYYLLDVYSVHGRAPIERFPRRIKATCVLFFLLVASAYAAGVAHWPVGAIAATFLLMIVLPLLAEDLVRSVLIRFELWGLPAVVIGAGPVGQEVVRVLRQTPELGLRPVAFFEDDNPEPGVGQPDIPLLGSIADSARYSDRIHTAIVTTPRETHETVGAVAMRLGYREIIIVPNLRDLPSLWVGARDLSGMIGLQMRRNLLLRRNRLLKFTLDYVLAVPLLVLCTPIIMGLALWIMIESNGSPFYSQTRAGKDGRPIKVWKLRTMHVDAEAMLERHLAENPAAREEWDRHCKLAHDPRVLRRVGSFLRRTSLDELPQILNVVRGEMSLVGPRPFPQYHLSRFDSDFQRMRSSVTPGITGLWQISARSEGDLDVQRALDTFYIRNWSIWMDFFILFRTVGAVLGGRGAC